MQHIILNSFLCKISRRNIHWKDENINIQTHLIDAHEKSQHQNHFEKLHFHEETNPIEQFLIHIDEHRDAVNHL